MNKITTLLFFGLILFFNQINGQNFNNQFNELVSKKDTVGQQQLLEKWEKTNNNDPELFVAYFNYFVNKSKKLVMKIDGNPKGNDALAVMDKDSSKKEPVAYLYGETYYDTEILKNGFDYIDKGIEKYPTRLDMRFGKIYMYGKIKDYGKFTTEIIKTIEYSPTIKNKWTWKDGKAQKNPKEFMLSAIQDYQVQLYETQDNNLLDNMKSIAETVLKNYPTSIESLSNLSIVFMIQEQYDKALEQLLKAENINPQDYIVLNNIAQAYMRKGDNKNAIKYYELTIKYGDERTNKYAQEQIEVLKKK